MGTATREVVICDGCGTHDDVSDWPQIGGDWCHDCAYDQLDNHQCKICQDFDVNCGSLSTLDGKNICAYCIEDADMEAAAEAEEAEANE